MNKNREGAPIRLFLLILLASLTLNLNVQKSSALGEGAVFSYEFSAISISNLKFLENVSSTIYDVALLVSNWDETSYLNELNVSIYDLDGNLVLSGVSNNTGYLNVELEEEHYIILVRSGDRVVGRQEIYVNKSGIIVVKAWAYTLHVMCVDQENNYVPGVIVSLFSQIETPITDTVNSVINETWRLVRLAKTNMSGEAIFDNIWNGTYKIIVGSDRVIGEKTMGVTKSEHVTIKCDKTYLELKVVTSTLTEYPLSNATVILQDISGHTVLKGYTNLDGYAYFRSVYIDNYTVFIDWAGVEVFSGIINTNTSRSLKIRASVFEVTLRVIDPAGNILPYSKISLKRMGRYVDKVLELKTDKNGLASFLLPPSTYEVSSSHGIYFGKTIINLTNNYSGTIQCGIQFNVWALLFLISLPLSILSVLLERSKLKKPLEYKRYQGILTKLESMYSNGLVEYKIYKKLKEEYETKLMELGGRRRR